MGVNPVKSLPDSIGWWIREGDTGPTEIREFCSPDGKCLRAMRPEGGEPGMRTMPCTPGRWIKVELPTFPPREKAAYRLCWANISGLGVGLTLWKNGSGFFREGFFPKDQASDVVWITGEFLDELPQR